MKTISDWNQTEKLPICFIELILSIWTAWLLCPPLSFARNLVFHPTKCCSIQWNCSTNSKCLKKNVIGIDGIAASTSRWWHFVLLVFHFSQIILQNVHLIPGDRQKELERLAEYKTWQSDSVFATYQNIANPNKKKTILASKSSDLWTVSDLFFVFVLFLDETDSSVRRHSLI